ncbi:MAG: hypothetical protein IPK17_19450 [Chloroflexi bacterium]|uniref:hypothetical protein n=1 Tax=Candidatus Flexifilum breve TaxID=3140694 RepID=UPI003134BB11|nr:hypothetical protein [Chloroflexota bacterium]
MESIILSGERVHLRDWMLTDLEAFAHWQQPGQRWQELDGPYYPGPKADDISGHRQAHQNAPRGNFSTPRQNLIIALRSQIS